MKARRKNRNLLYAVIGLWVCICFAAISHADALEKVGAQLQKSLRPYLDNHEIPQRPNLPADHAPPDLDDLRAQLRRLEEAYRKGRYSPDHYDEDWLKLNKQIQEIENRDVILAATRREIEQQMESLGRTLGPHLHKIHHWLADWDQGEVNRTLHLLLEQIVVTPIPGDHVVELFYRKTTPIYGVSPAPIEPHIGD